MDPRKLVVEFIGTFFLVLVIGLTVVVGHGAGGLAPLAIGATLMVMVYMGGHLSGGHYNPAVTLGVYLRGACPASAVLPYMLTQIAAGIVAGLAVNYFNGGAVVSSGPGPDVAKALLIEFLFTFALVNSVLNTATSKKVAGNSYYGLAIGFTVVIGAFAGGGISGGAYNPAVAAGVTTMGLSPIGNIWIFLVPNFLAGAAAAGVYKFINPDEQ